MATTVTTQFPADAVQSALRAELINSVKSAASVTGVVLPSSPGAVAQTPLEIDSLLVLSILCTVEPHLGFELPQSVVRTGGYRSVDAAVKHLLVRIESEWKKQKGGSP